MIGKLVIGIIIGLLVCFAITIITGGLVLPIWAYALIIIGSTIGTSILFYDEDKS